ncbi:MAG TPA: hypothetical protein DDY75_16055 [Sphingobacterium sp.]|nr:hypothetical protein [Sphingobacterium sp.]HAL53882.1 hypothetical protein [Sphingobacterium sp.]HBI89352.1 hypothetical protein [Sphingobacterium sp.]
MTHFYKGGSELPIGTQCSCLQQTKSNCLKLSILIWGIVMFSMFSLSAQTPRKDSGADGLQLIKPLKIGDSIPQWLWNHPVGVANHATAKTTISLQEYRTKKLIILDFWATWCAPCIAMMDKTEPLQQANKEDIQIIPVTYEPLSKVNQFVDRRIQNDKSKTKLFTVYNETTLQKAFPHKLLPHYVWISTSGIFLGASNGDQLTQANIDNAINGIVSFSQKKDFRIPYQSKRSMLQANNGLEDDDLTSYSLFGTYKAGMPAGRAAGQLDDGRSRLTYINGTLSSLLGTAYSRPDRYFGRNRIKFITGDSTMYAIPKNEDTLKQWRKDHLFCYESVGRGSVNELRKTMQQDLKRQFPYLDIDTQSVHHLCWVMKGNSTNPKLRSKGGKRRNIVDRNGCSLRNASLFDLFFSMNFYLHQNSKIPFEYEIEGDEAVDLEFFTDMRDMDAVNKKLKPYGISFVLERRPVEMVVVTDLREKGANHE